MYLVLVRDEGIDSKYLEVNVIGEEVKNNHVQLVKGENYHNILSGTRYRQISKIYS